MDKKYEELIEACRAGHMYDFILNNAHRFTKEEIVEILAQTLYAVYQRLGDQNKEVEQKIPDNLNDYSFFDTDGVKEDNEIKLYCQYLAGSLSFSQYYEMCKNYGYEIKLAK